MRLVLVISGIASAWLFARGLPGIATLPAWFHPLHPERPLGPAFLGLTLAAAPIVVKWALAQGRRGNHATALTALMLLGIALQFTLHFLVPQGIYHSLEGLHHGHGEFLRVAAARRGQFLSTLRDYDALFARGELGAFAGTKGPGNLAVYMVVDALAQLPAVVWLLSPLLEVTRASALVSSVAQAAALWLVLYPLLTWLALAPLFGLSTRLFRDEDAAYGTALLMLTSPAMLLIDLTLDGALFPLITLGVINGAVAGARSGRAVPAVLAGMLATLGVYCTFGLLPSAALALAFTFFTSVDTAVGVRSVRSALVQPSTYRACAAFLLGAALCLGLLVLWLHYQPLERFRSAMAVHTEWKSSVPTRLWRKLSLVEFGVAVGAPLVLAFVTEVLRSAMDLARWRRPLLGFVTLTVVGALGVLAATQGTVEVARMWLFMVPLVCLCVACGVQVRSAAPGMSRTLHVLAATQIGLALFVRARIW